MLRLNLSTEPQWLDLGHGVRLLVEPLTTAIMLAARSDPAIIAAAADAEGSASNDDLARIVIVIAASEKNLEVMRKFSEQYARGSGTYFCMDKSVTAVVIQGLAEHKDTLGAPLCPCRHYDDKEAEVANGFWNCPCVPMRERKECHCMLFLTEDNDFAGEEQTITTEELIELTEDM